MNTSLVITVLAEDRPGLVNQLSEILRIHQANWMESRMVRLSGKFAGLLQVSVADGRLAALTSALEGLQNSGMQILVEKTQAFEALSDNPLRPLRLEVLGQDRPGIIDDITSKLSALDVNIEEMSSEQRVASMSNEVLFFAELLLQVPATIKAEDVQETLEELSDQLMVDINFS